MPRALAGLLAVAVAVLAGAPALAGSSRAGTSGAAFLKVPVGPRNIAMGEVYAALGDDPFVVWGQPAVWARGDENPTVAFQQNEYLLDMNQQFLGGYWRMFGGGTGLAVTRFDAGDLTRTFENAAGQFTGSGGTFDAGDWAVAVGHGRRLNDRWTVGVTGKLLRSEIDDVDATTFGFDVGARYEHSPRLTLGLAVTNIGRGQKFDNQRDDLPITVRFGGAYRVARRLVAAFDLAQARDHSFEAHAGLEWRPLRPLALRLGYSQVRDDDVNEGLTAGLGLAIGSFAIDYAYVPFGLLGDAHRFGVTYHFRGLELDEPIARTERPAWWERPTAGPSPSRAAATPTAAAAPVEVEHSPTLRTLSRTDEPGRYGEYFRRYSQLYGGSFEY